MEVWTPNATLTKGECKYVDGNATADFAGQGFSSRPGGSLFTGMIAPFVNYAIKGAVWCESFTLCGSEMLCSAWVQTLQTALFCSLFPSSAAVALSFD